MAGKVPDPGAFPFYRAYVAQLPAGIDSYPECMISAEYPAALQASYAHVWKSIRLPLDARRAMSSDWSKVTWLPLVHAVAQSTLICEHELMLPETFRARTLEMHKKYLQQLKGMPRAASPHVFVLGAERRWNQSYRGCQLKVGKIEKCRYAARLDYPPKIFPQSSLDFIAHTFSVMLTLAGIQGAWTEAEAESDSAALMRGGWTE